MPRPCSRFVKSLCDDDRAYLTHVWRTHPAHSVRSRAHAILLSARGISVPEITKIFGIDDDTARSWLKRWEERGRDGLEDESRSGGPPKLDKSERSKALAHLEEHPHNPRLVLEEIKQQTGKSVSHRTLGRWARSAGMRWKRLGKSLKKLRDPELFAKIKDQLGSLAATPEVKLAYFDEATFSLTAIVPYGWQKIGDRKAIELSGARHSIHVLGIEEPNKVVSYIHKGSINGPTVAAVLDDYAARIRKPTILVLDNASPHTCKLIHAKKAEWEKRGLILFPLPAYSPELNQIEHLWKDVKYTQLPITAWNSLKALTNGLIAVFQQLGRTVLMPSIEGIA